MLHYSLSYWAAWLLTTLLCCASWVSYATDFPVSSAPEAQERLDQAMPSDVIIVEDGPYTNFRLTISASGTADQPITVRAENGGEVILSGNSGFLITGDYVVVDGFRFDAVPQMSSEERRVIQFDGSDNSKLVNCAFYTCGNDRFRHLIRISGGSSNNEVAYNYLENTVGQGIGVSGSAENVGNHIHHNQINGTKDDGEANGQEPIQLGQSKDHYGNDLSTLVEYNLIENMQGDADGEVISNKSKGNVIRYNTCQNNDRREIVLRGGEAVTVENNYLIATGIRAHGHDHTIRNNYLQGAGDGIRLPGGSGVGTTGSYPETYNCLIENNLIISSDRHGVRIGHSGGGLGGEYLRDITIRNNEVRMDQGEMYQLESANQGNMSWIDNVGNGDASLRVGNISSSGVNEGSVDSSSDLTPLTQNEVGPDWRGREPDNNGDNGGGSDDDPFTIVLEAEVCSTIGATWNVNRDVNASGGEYVEIQPGNTDQSTPPTAVEDRVSFTFDVTQAGRHTLWGRVLTPTSGDDSFWVRVNGGGWQIWSTGTFTEWSWSERSSYDFSAGSNTIDIAYREDGAQLDKLYLSSDGRVPTGRDPDSNCEDAGAADQVTLRAWGASGEEQLEVLRNNKVVDTVTLTTVPTEYQVPVDKPAGNFTVAFINDDVGRDVVLDWLTVGEERRQTEEQRTNTAAWTPEGGCGTGSFTEEMPCLGKVDFGNFGGEPSSLEATPASSPTEVLPFRVLAYPNPASDELTVEGSQDYRVSLYDLRGQPVMQRQHLRGRVTLDISHLRPGVYLLSIYNVNPTSFQRRLMVVD